MESILLAESTTPAVSAPPPVMTAPEGIFETNSSRSSSILTIVNISFRRGLIIPSRRVFLETFLISAIPSPVRSISSPSESSESPIFFFFVERAIFIFSAVSRETRRPIAKSLVIFLAPTGITPEYVKEPSMNTAIDVVPPPISIRTLPSSFSVGETAV